jgi:predicted N-acyltransferase
MDETVPNVADASAPELEATAAIEPVENTTPETPAEQEANKSFTQEELDAIVGKRLAREQRKWEREQAQKAEEMQARQQVGYDITPEQFETYEDYAEVLAERKAEELLARRETARQQADMTVKRLHGISMMTLNKSHTTPTSRLRISWRKASKRQTQAQTFYIISAQIRKKLIASPA